MVSGRDGAQLETRSTRSDPVTAGATPQFASQVRAQVTVYIGRYPRGATGGDDIPMRADARELIYQLAFEARASEFVAVVSEHLADRSFAVEPALGELVIGH